jgi:hypothetical protein
MFRKVMFVTFLFFILFISCKRGGVCDNLPQILVHYVDQAGNNLFTNGQNGYVKDSFLIASIGGAVVPNSKSAFVDWTSSTIQLGPSIYVNITNQYATLIIYLKNGVSDTLKMHLTSKSISCSQLDSIWYNGQLKKANMQVINGVSNPDLYSTLFTVTH